MRQRKENDSRWNPKEQTACFYLNNKTKHKCQKYVLSVWFALHMLFQSFPWSTSIRDASDPVSEERPKHFPWEHFQKYCRYCLSLKMPLWCKEYLCPFYNLTSLRKEHGRKAQAIAVQKFVPIKLSECCVLTVKAFQSLTVLILGWNGLEPQRNYFCCSITCFQPNVVMFWHFLSARN